MHRLNTPCRHPVCNYSRGYCSVNIAEGEISLKKRISQKEITQFKQKMIRDEKSSATIQKYIRDIEAFHSFAGKEEVTKEMVICYKQYLMNHYAPSSVNSMLAAINCFFREMKWNDCVVKVLKIQKQVFREKERELSKEEYYRLLESARKRKDRRLYLLMQTICATGIRVSELKFITLEAVNFGKAVVSMKGKTRMVLLPKALCRELKNYARNRCIQSGSIFVTRNGRPMDRSNILHYMKALCTEAGVDRKKVFPHNLRHLFACLYYKAEKDLSRLADILGHASINTTRIYISVSGEEQARQIEQLDLVIGEEKVPLTT